jgi:hypothetical protein
MMHTVPATQAEMLDVLALFPKCTRCGATLSVAEPIEPDSAHAFRLKHCGLCPTTPHVA